MTRVISVRGKKRSELEADPTFRYVGRSVRYTAWDQTSDFANPFSIHRYGIEALSRFVRHMHIRMKADPGFRARIIAKLRGKTLGCWCLAEEWNTDMESRPACHAVVLACIAEGVEIGIKEWEN
jgi:hypothetical protein